MDGLAEGGSGRLESLKGSPWRVVDFGLPRGTFLFYRKLRSLIKQNPPGDAHFAHKENGC